MKTNLWLTFGIVLLSLTLLVSLSANFVLFNQAEKYYLQLNGVRLDPLSLNAYPPEINQSLTAKNQKVVVFFGDSRAFAWPAPDDLTQLTFMNRAIGSQTTEQVVSRYEAHVKPLSADILIVQVGVNDLKTVPLFLERKDAIIENSKANIAKIIELARQDGSTVILTTIFPLGEVPIERRLFWSPDVAEAIDEVNAFLYTLEADDVIIFETAPVLAGADGQVKNEYSFDLLHLNPAGYQALNEKLLDVLRQF